MQFANQRWFDLGDALLLAQGKQQSKPIIVPGKPTDWETNGGIHCPSPKGLPPRTRIVRFSGSSDPKTPGDARGGSPIPAMAVGGCWWLEWPEYKIVEAYSNSSKCSISSAVRSLCCVPTEWNDATVVVQAVTKLPLLAYSGFGAPAEDKTGRVLDGANPGGRQVQQLYIPGMASADLRHDAIMISGSGFLPPDP